MHVPAGLKWFGYHETYIQSKNFGLALVSQSRRTAGNEEWGKLSDWDQGKCAD